MAWGDLPAKVRKKKFFCTVCNNVRKKAGRKKVTLGDKEVYACTNCLKNKKAETAVVMTEVREKKVFSTEDIIKLQGKINNVGREGNTDRKRNHFGRRNSSRVHGSGIRRKPFGQRQDRRSGEKTFKGPAQKRKDNQEAQREDRRPHKNSEGKARRHWSPQKQNSRVRKKGKGFGNPKQGFKD